MLPRALKRRPTAADRDLANWIERLPPGRYRIDVIDGEAATGRYFGLAPLKREGSLVLQCQAGNRIEIYPIKGDVET